MEVRPPNLPLNVERLKRLEPSAAVERLEQLELTDPHDEWSIAVERFERLEQPHPEWTAISSSSSLLPDRRVGLA